MNVQNTATQDASSTGLVIAFPEPQNRPQRGTVRRLTLRDRVAVVRWADLVRPNGISRAAIHTGGDPNMGDFILIYLTGALWASWVIGCKPAGYCVWRAGSGADLGCFPSLAQALVAVETML